MTCDFCSDRGARWRYPCEDLARTMYDPGGQPVRIYLLGAWHACAPCYQLVERDKWRKLSRRSHRLYVAAHPMLSSFAADSALSEMVAIHGQFAAGRTGPAVDLAVVSS